MKILSSCQLENIPAKTALWGVVCQQFVLINLQEQNKPVVAHMMNVSVLISVFYSVLLFSRVEPLNLMGFHSSKIGNSCVSLCNDGSVFSLAFLCTKLINSLDNITSSQAFSFKRFEI